MAILNFSSLVQSDLYLFYLGLALYFIYDLFFRSTTLPKSLTWIVLMLFPALCGVDFVHLFWPRFQEDENVQP